MKKISCFCKAAAWGFFGGGGGGGNILFVLYIYKQIRLVHQCLLKETRIIPVGAVPYNSRGLQREHFVYHIAAPSEGNLLLQKETSMCTFLQVISA